MNADRNKARVLELVERVLNQHDLAALDDYTSNPAVIGSATGLVRAFPDLQADVRWIVADDDMAVVFYDVRGTQKGPWLFVQQATGCHVQTSFLLAVRFDDSGQIVDQWLGSNFIEMFAQLGWGVAPVGSVVPERD